MRYLESWDRFGAYLNQPAGGAGTFASIRLRNPTGSNVIAVMEKILLVDGDAVADSYGMSLAAQTADLSTGVALTANRFDNRGRSSPTLLASRQALGAAGPANQLTVNILASTSYECILDSIHELTLLPGDAIQITNQVGNNTANVTFWWRERALEPSELF
jgi:hypothetical protein